MRKLILVLACICNHGQAADLASCLEIESAVKRLDCYDQLARDTAVPAEKTTPAFATLPESDSPAADSATIPESQPRALDTDTVLRMESPVTNVVPLQTQPTNEIETQTIEPGKPIDRDSQFGLKPRRNKQTEITRVNAILDKVEYMDNGKKVFTLSNGQVWVEREPTPRKIAIGQPVSITKKRWHFELDPQRGPKVTVQRLDPDGGIIRKKYRGDM